MKTHFFSSGQLLTMSTCLKSLNKVNKATSPVKHSHEKCPSRGMQRRGGFGVKSGFTCVTIDNEGYGTSNKQGKVPLKAVDFSRPTFGSCC